MNSITRGLGLAIAGCAAGLALSSAPAHAANVALMVNGIGASDLNDLAMSNILGGMFGGSGYMRQMVPWPQQSRPVTGPTSMTLGESVDAGANNLDAALDKALLQLKPGERVTIVGLSAGALVADEQMRRLTTDPTAPGKDKLAFVVIADSSRNSFNRNRYDAILDYTYRPPVDSIYDTTAVVAEYDGYADFPDRPTNRLAVQNAIAGANIVHLGSMVTDLSKVPAKNITVTTNSLGGVTTSYLVPTAELPLVTANPALKPQEARLRAIVDSAYLRNDRVVAAAASAQGVRAAQTAGAGQPGVGGPGPVAERAGSPKSAPRAARHPRGAA